MARRLMPGSRVVLATHNPGKLREMTALVAPLGFDLLSAGELALPEPDESAPDFSGNARIKALAAAQASALPALADDSGFCVAALGGAPGVFSARWAGSDRDFAPAMARVHREMGEAGDRRAWFVATLCLAWPDGATATFMGRVDGSVTWPPRGDKGFGYDPIFVPAGTARTFGQMAADEKQAHNHRARAFAQLRAACLKEREAMATSNPAGHTEIFPYIFYRDVPAALDWLARAFGFTEEMRHATPSGMHAQMTLDGQRIMMGSGHQDSRMRSARDTEAATQGIFVYLADVDAHYERARAAGAEIVHPPRDESYGRTYTARDLDGHPWFFTTPPA